MAEDCDIVERLREECDEQTYIGHADLVVLLSTAADEIMRLRVALDAIDVLHQPDGKTGLCSECAQSDGFMTDGYTDGPCDTYLLLHPTMSHRD